MFVYLWSRFYHHKPNNMKFELSLFAPEYAVAIPFEDLGIEGVDFVRSELGLDLPIERIEHKSIGLSKNIKIELDEETARESGRFQNSNLVEITFEEKGALNKFCNKSVGKKTREDTGEVVSAHVYWVPDAKAIIEAWRVAGFRDSLETPKMELVRLQKTYKDLSGEERNSQVGLKMLARIQELSVKK